MKLFKTALLILIACAMFVSVGCGDPCEKSCKKFVECKIMKDQKKCVEECKKEKDKEKDKFDKQYKKLKPLLGKDCKDFKKGLAEIK